MYNRRGARKESSSQNAEFLDKCLDIVYATVGTRRGLSTRDGAIRPMHVERMAMGAHVEVDLDLCQGHAMCQLEACTGGSATSS